MEKEQQLYRKESTDRIASPDQLTDYLRVTNPPVWIVLGAVTILLIGLLLWSAIAHIDSFVGGYARVNSNTITMYFDKASMIKNVKTGMKIMTEGGEESEITEVGRDDDGKYFAKGESSLPDGVYDARVYYKSTRVMELLFN